MAKRTKKYQAAAEQIADRAYPLDEAISVVQKIAYAKFDECVDVSMKLGVDPRHADQMVRGSVKLPHGTGKTSRVVVFAQGEKAKEAEEAGADFVGTDELVTKIQSGWLDFEAVVATPDMMRHVGKLGRVLGPRGLMPNPKTGTVTMDVKQVVIDIKSGRVEYRVDKGGNIHGIIGRKGFSADQLKDNAAAFVGAILKAKPSALKGKYIRSMTVSTTMSPGISIDLASLEA